MRSAVALKPGLKETPVFLNMPDDEDFSSVVPLVQIENMYVDVFPTLESMLNRIVQDIRSPGQAKIFSLNVHGANMAYRFPRFKRLIQQADTLICDGTGILMASRILPGLTIPCRFAAGDYLPDLLKRLSQENLTAFFLAGEPGVAEQALRFLEEKIPGHTVVGCHHGYIAHDKKLEDQVIEQINRLAPDVLFIGFGMPLQEYWIEENMHRLDVRAFFPFGATLDYLSRKVPRCPAVLGKLGLEWLFRFCLEPSRMFERYMMGNPRFMARIIASAIRMRLLKAKTGFHGAGALKTG